MELTEMEKELLKLADGSPDDESVVVTTATAAELVSGKEMI